jgi:XkdW protein
MTLYEKIKTLHPKLEDRDFMSVIMLQNDSDGNGDYIAKWDHPTIARPTDEELADGNLDN